MVTTFSKLASSNSLRASFGFFTTAGRTLRRESSSPRSFPSFNTAFKALFAEVTAFSAMKVTDSACVASIAAFLLSTLPRTASPSFCSFLAFFRASSASPASFDAAPSAVFEAATASLRLSSSLLASATAAFRASLLDGTASAAAFMLSHELA